MELPSLIGHISELFRIVNKSSQPPDKITGEYLRSKKYIGSTDRKFISESLFNLLRMKSIPEFIYKYKISGGIKNSLNIEYSDFLFCIIGIHAINKLGINSGVLRQKLSDKAIDINAQFSSALQNKLNIGDEVSELIIKLADSSINELAKQAENSGQISDLNQFAAFYGQQDWIITKLRESGKFNHEELKSFLKSLLSPSPLVLRINAAASYRNDILDKMRIHDDDCQITGYSPFGIKLSKRIDLNMVPLFKSGVIEVQDEGSQLIGIALGAHHGENILDACAGAGGKSIQIASMLHDNCVIYATDVENSKLRELNSRARRAGLSSISTKANKELLDSKLHFDKVLVDSPCSGMGTVRRNPMIKWRLTPELLEKYISKQKMIISRYSKYVKPGGILLYSTCSILDDENRNVVEWFLNEHSSFEPSPLKQEFDEMEIMLPGMNDDSFDYNTYPHIHACDGFYFARLRKKDE